MSFIEVSGAGHAAETVLKAANSLQSNCKLMLEKLGALGVNTATVKFSSASYDGDKDVSVKLQWVSDNKLKVVASGKSVLFIEFGSGLIGYGHPLAGDMGYGPGTWSDGPNGKHRWKQWYGWYYPPEGKKSYGNAPARAMYDAGKEMRENIERIAREVFNID